MPKAKSKTKYTIDAASLDSSDQVIVSLTLSLSVRLRESRACDPGPVSEQVRLRGSDSEPLSLTWTRLSRQLSHSVSCNCVAGTRVGLGV